MVSLIDEVLDHAFHFTTLSTQDRIYTVVFDTAEQVSFYLIRQDVVGETLDKLISNYFKIFEDAESV